MTCVLCFPVVSENSHRNRLVTALPEKEERSAPKIIGRPRRRRQEDLNCYRHSSKKNALHRCRIQLAIYPSLRQTESSEDSPPAAKLLELLPADRKAHRKRDTANTLNSPAPRTDARIKQSATYIRNCVRP